MERPASIDAPLSAKQSPVELLARRLNRFIVSPLLLGIVIALGLAIIAGWVAIRLSQSYYMVAPYHYDSASYRLQALQFHDMLVSEGTRFALLQSLQSKDSLDISLRILFAPNFLLYRYGHMAVLLPLMSIWIFLVFWYVFIRTRSRFFGFLVAVFLFSFPMMFNPYNGIADNWKDNLATWLLGSAVLAWLLAETLQKPGWSVICGFLLGLLVMQRSVAAVYTFLLFLPLFFVAAYQRIRNDGFKSALIKIGALVVPAGLLGSLVVTVQFEKLYSYYFVAGYSYGTPGSVALYLAAGLPTGIGFILFVLCGISILLLASISDWRQQLGDILTAGWMAIGLPCIVIFTSAFYFGFFPLWSVLLLTVLATLIPRSLNERMIHIYALLLIMVALVSSVVQYNVSSIQSQSLAKEHALQRRLFQELSSIILAQPEPHRYVLLFDEVAGPFLNQVYFDTGMRLPPSVAFMSVHDSYYRAMFGSLDSKQIVQRNILEMEHEPGTLAVIYCDPNGITKLPYADALAKQVAINLGSYLLHSSRWAVTNRLDSPYGCLYVYRYTAQDLTDLQKWEKLSFYQTLSEIPLALSLGPSVRMYEYISRYQPELIDGVYYQWLPSGENSLRLTLFSSQAQTVRLETYVRPGPARKDALRTLMLSVAQQTIELPIEHEQAMQIPISLQPGLNQIDISIKEGADTVSSPGADPRELMLLLESPRLVPATH